jgi:hypothetical protein
MGWTFRNPNLGMPGILSHIAAGGYVPVWKLGDIQQAYDPTLGMAEFIYLKGIGSTIVGSMVNYDDGFTTALDTAAVTGPSRALAIAMSACVADEYGWYQISGNAVAAKANTVSFADGAGLGSASGLAVAVVTGTVLQAAVVRTVASAKSNVTTVAIAINRPHTPSDIS